MQNSIYIIFFNTNSTSLFNVYLVVNSILVVYLLRLSEGEIKPLLTYLPAKVKAGNLFTIILFLLDGANTMHTVFLVLNVIETSVAAQL